MTVGPDSAPDLAEPVVGWRAWRLLDLRDGPQLLSPMVPAFWPHRRPMVASCARGCGGAPSSDCSCGLYATSALGRLLGHTGHGYRVVGCTALWGRVVEHTDGVRGEFAYPLVLFLLTSRLLTRPRSALDVGDDLRGPRGEHLARSLARRYGVPTRPVDDLSDRYRDEAPAQAVCREASRGLAARRAGDRAAHVRLDAAVDDLFGRPGRGVRTA